MSRIVIKIGTSTLTRGGGPPDAAYIADLAAQVARQQEQGHSVVLVSSGAIRAGMARLNLDGRPRTIPQKQAAAAVGQGRLMQTYAQAFDQHDIAVAQILLTRDDLRDRTRYLNARNTFTALLRARAVPIVNENDTVAVEEIKFGDNDTLAALVASLIEADALLLLSDVAGLYDRDPTQFPEARLIPVVEAIDKTIEHIAGGVQTEVGTGGMTTKIAAAKICAGSGVRMTVADGRHPNVVAEALAGHCGTLFLPRDAPLRARQRWIAYGVVPKGTVTVNDGARVRLVGEGSSLLPAGITHVSGHFQAGELVRLLDARGRAFGQGFVNYDHAALTSIMGRRTEEIADILGTKVADEVIHRDNMVLEA